MCNPSYGGTNHLLFCFPSSLRHPLGFVKLFEQRMCRQKEMVVAGFVVSCFLFLSPVRHPCLRSRARWALQEQQHNGFSWLIAQISGPVFICFCHSFLLTVAHSKFVILFLLVNF